MGLNKVADRYSKTLFLSSQADKKILEAVADDMRNLDSLLQNNTELARALKNPLINPGNLQKLFHKILPSTINLLTKNFIDFLFLKKRGNALVLIPKKFNVLYEKEKKIKRVLIKSAVPFSKDQIETFKSKILKKAGVGSVIIENEVDSNLIAGFQMISGDTVYDANLRQNITNLRKKLAA